MLAVVMGMAADRFDTRRGLVLAEANAIGKAYLRRATCRSRRPSELRELLREYLPLRIATNDLPRRRPPSSSRSSMHAEMWAIVEPVARSGYNSDLMSSLGESRDGPGQPEPVARRGRRLQPGPRDDPAAPAGGLGVVAWDGRVRRRSTGRRSVVTAVILVVALGAVLTVVDRPRPAAGGLPPGQPAAAPRRPALDRHAHALTVPSADRPGVRRLGPPGQIGSTEIASRIDRIRLGSSSPAPGTCAFAIPAAQPSRAASTVASPRARATASPPRNASPLPTG